MATRRRCGAFLPLLLAAALLPPAWAGASPPITSQANTYTVWSNGDGADSNPGNGLCDPPGGVCTLHAAIDEANADGVPSVIVFGKRFTDTDYINGNLLPAVTSADTIIDGVSQWDVASARPGVDIRAGAGGTAILLAGSRNVVRGLSLSGSGNGVHIVGGSDNTVGGTGTHEGNVFIIGNYSVWTEGGTTGSGSGNTIAGNYVGTATGSSIAIAGAKGILLQTDLNNVTANVIVGQASGVEVWGSGNLIYGNTIGLSTNLATALPNACGVTLYQGSGNAVGPGNYIAGNTGYGVSVYHAEFNTVRDNWIGYGSVGNGSDGVNILDGGSTVLRDNVIAANAGDGVHTYSSLNLDIRGNTIGTAGLTAGNTGHGIYLDSLSTAQIGGSTAADRNVIGGNGGDGIHLDASHGVTIAGNWIGLDAAGAFDAGNSGYGIFVSGSGNTVGGATGASGNWVAYNHLDGIRLQGTGATGNYVLSNVIGASINWKWPAGNGHHGIALYDGATSNYVGVLFGGGNTVLANGWSGIALAGASGNYVLNNRIGTNGADVHFGNGFHGVHIASASEDAMGANEIAYNAVSGVRVEGSAAFNDRLVMNSIHDNGAGALAAGIVLVSGGNSGIAAPTIASANCSGASGTACANCDVQVYSDAGDQGRVYHDHVTANGAGAWTYTGALAGPNVTAVLTDASGNSSAFSAPFAVGVCNTGPTAAFAVTPSGGTPATVFRFDASGCSDLETPAVALEVRWDWEDDGTYDTDWSATKTASHSYASMGLMTVRVQVRDGGGLTADATRQVQVSEQSPPGASDHYLPIVLHQQQ